MESRDRAAQTLSDATFIWRTRMAACWLVLTAIAFIQQPGRIVADTKLDLVVDPGRFMERATSLWDPIGFFGQVQNQAYGYFIPMGPFFLGGEKLQVEPWIVQRLWWALLLVVAFTGFVLLARELDIGAPWAQLVGGFAFALSPRMMSVIGPSSIEVWPMAVAPWVLLALVIGTTRRSPVAMAALSATAVATVGGVNAVATFAVLPLGALWLVMSPPGPRRRRMMIAWPGFVLLATLWWLVPLALLGQYSPPFLDFIESASLTSFDTTLLDSLRGTSNWTAYLSATSVAGNNLISEPILLLNLAVVLALSTAGLARGDLPHRRFLFVSVLVGLVLVTLGHTASHGGLGAPELQSLLDGVLSPLRNTHKFDVVVRLPLVLALVHVLTKAYGELSTRTEGGRVQSFSPTFGFAVLGVVAVLGATSPAWTGQLAPRGSFESIPDYWKDTASWLAKQDADERALVVPASAFGSYLWGYTNDDVLQPLATSPWAVRNAIPLAPPGNIQMLDAVERELTDGRGSPALSEYLLDSGVSLLVVRNDLAVSADGLDPEIVHSALERMPQVERVAAFGPEVGGSPTLEQDGAKVFVDQGWQSEREAVEIYRVGHRPPVRVQAADDVPVVVGGADSHVGLLASGLVDSPSVIYAADLPVDRDPNAYVLTDGQRRREVAFGRVHDNRSASVAPDETYGADRPVHAYETSESDRWKSVPELIGASSITASSAASTVRTVDKIDLSAQPWSAFDGDPMTEWRASRTDSGERSWIRIDFEEPVNLSSATVTLAGGDLSSVDLAVLTDEESAIVPARRGVAQRLVGLTRPARYLTISAPSTADDVLSISEVRVPGVKVSRPLRLPTPGASWGRPQGVLLQAGGGHRDGCLTVDGYLRCASGQDSWGEDGRVIDRIVPLPAATTLPMSLTVEPIGGAGLDALMQQDRLVTIRASSQVVRSARASSMAAADGDPRTTWVASSDDPRPRLTAAWIGERTVSRVSARVDGDAAASRPTEAFLRFSDGSRQAVEFDAKGVARFEPVSTQMIEMEVTRTSDVRNLDATGSAQVLPVGVSELRIGGTDLLPLATETSVKRYACGSGPTVRVGKAVIKTRISASPADLRSGSQIEAAQCKEQNVDLREGENRIRVTGTEAFRPVSLALGDRVEAPVLGSAKPGSCGATNRTVTTSGGDRQLLTVTENFNKGWETDVRRAQPVVVNGWQQGWELPRGMADDDVALTYAPNSLYRAGLVAGGALLVILLIVTAALVRRSPMSLLAAEPRSFRRRDAALSAVLLVGFGLVVGGIVGLVVGMVGYGAATMARRWVEPAVVAGSLVMVVAGASAVRPWGGSETWLGAMDWPQVMIAVACGVVAASVFGLPKRRSRSTGDSTTT